MLVEGPNLVDEALTNGGRLVGVFGLVGDPVAERARIGGDEVIDITPTVLDRLSTTDSPQSPVAIAMVPFHDVPIAGDLMCLWGVADPGNVGTLIRTAAAFGMSVAVGPDTADPWSPKAVRSGAGAHFRTAIAAVNDLEMLRVGGRMVAATVVSGGVAPEATSGQRPLAIVIGGEAHGLSERVAAAADLRITIPMPGGTESLNAAAAGAIIAYVVSRRAASAGD